MFSLRQIVAVLIACHSALALPSVTISSHGILGNSGHSGQTQVRFGVGEDRPQNSLYGLGLDGEGFLWNFAGPFTINRYAQDGRMMATFHLPKEMGTGPKSITVVDDRVIILANQQLWMLPIASASGAAPERIALDIKVEAISLSPVGRKLALIGDDRDLFVWDAHTGDVTHYLPLPLKYDGQVVRGDTILLLPDGGLLVDGQLRVDPDGGLTMIEGMPTRFTQWVNGSVYSYTWHMSIHRLQADGTPHPGVVYGGKSGAFLGRLHEDGEVDMPSGLVHLGGARYAVTSDIGVIHLLLWDPQKRFFTATRRIGAIYRESGLGVDRQGRVWWNTGYWDWSDGPAHTLRNTTYTTEADGWQLVFNSSDAMSGLSYRRNAPILLLGPVDFDRERFDAGVSRYSLPSHVTGAALLEQSGEETVAVVDAKGLGALLPINNIGGLRSAPRPFRLQLKIAAHSITSLAVTSDGSLFAADGDELIGLKREGDVFYETSRSDRWLGSGGDCFGAGIYIASDGQNLWVSDPVNQRIVLLEVLPDGNLSKLGVFSGDPMIGHLSEPRRIAASGGRAVVMDSGNQRLVKLQVHRMAED
ncbi:NHL repeat-containing protein [Puniceicoccus vermicola]|uniref:Uncharacterized protein n=1 Tax=Puniceicoccus vermicola TaxID=388746 RepID=A0A7X1B2Q9_9BACT|nr:hypothetical protein [Puniceicoccus vermicola]MBC2604314.1 hypothetical protein [Puniceicoccus vermicola]